MMLRAVAGGMQTDRFTLGLRKSCGIVQQTRQSGCAFDSTLVTLVEKVICSMSAHQMCPCQGIDRPKSLICTAGQS